METQTQTKQIEVKAGGIQILLKRISDKISSLFEPEEVEVTFKEVGGKKVGYTYTKVSHKQVA